MTGRRSLPLGVVLLLAALLWAPSLLGDFVYDDHYLIVDNPVVRSSDQVAAAFTRDYYGQRDPQRGLGYYRPITLLSHWLDWSIWGANPFGHHLTSLLLHLLATALLYLFVVETFGRPPLALLTATIFALHPTKAASVAFVSARVDLLAAVFVLAALLCATRNRWGPPAFYALGLLSKEMAVTLPALLFWRLRDQARRKWLASLVSMGVVLVAIALLRWAVLGHLSRQGAPLLDLSPHVPFLLLGDHLRNLMLPPLGILLEPPLSRLPWLLNFACLALYGLALARLPDRRVAGWGAVWLVTHLPILGLVGLETVVDDRFLYLPSIGFSLVAAAWIETYLERRRRAPAGGSRAVLVAVTLLTLILAPMALARQVYWHDDLNLFEAALESQPESADFHLKLGLALVERRRLDQAESEFLAGLPLADTGSVMASWLRRNIADTYLARGRLAEAEEWYRRAVEERPDYCNGHLGLALLLESGGRGEEALPHFKQALSCPESAELALRHLDSGLPTGVETGPDAGTGPR